VADLEAVRTLDVPGPMWHVTLTLSGDPVDLGAIRHGLERLAHERPFLLTGRYGHDRAEVRYWDEGADARTVTDLALRLWDEHRETSGLPQWTVVGVEVMDRETWHRRARRGASLGLSAVAAVTPF